MESKKVVKICIICFIAIILFYVFYFFTIRPHITGEYMPTDKDCKKGYDCVCLRGSCLCSYKDFFKENKVACPIDLIQEKQIKK